MPAPVVHPKPGPVTCAAPEQPLIEEVADIEAADDSTDEQASTTELE